MIPKKEINVIDEHGGFNALTKSYDYDKITNIDGKFIEWKRSFKERKNTLWRPGNILKDSNGILQEFNENSFFQNNNDVTLAIYKVKGYCNRIAVWYDNKTGKRIA